MGSSFKFLDRLTLEAAIELEISSVAELDVLLPKTSVYNFCDYGVCLKPNCCVLFGLNDSRPVQTVEESAGAILLDLIP